MEKVFKVLLKLFLVVVCTCLGVFGSIFFVAMALGMAY